MSETVPELDESYDADESTDNIEPVTDGGPAPESEVQDALDQ